jgi:hypothetical protein
VLKPISQLLGDFVRHPWIAILLVVGGLVGLWLGDDFGLSWDEVRNAAVGEDALRAYSGSDDYFSNSYLADHGPAYFMLFTATSRLVHQIAPSWSLADGRHLTNYATFLAGVLLLYHLCRRFMSAKSAGMAAALFATQPLLFGHGFVNQKDVPFMTFFLATVATGIMAADRWGNRNTTVVSSSPGSASSSGRAFVRNLGLEWHGLSRTSKWVLVSALGISLFLVVDLLFMDTLHGLGASIVAAAHEGQAPFLVQWAFSRVATDAHRLPVEAYLSIYEALFVNLRLAMALLLVLAWMTALGRAFPSLGGRLGVSWRALGGSGLLGSAILLGIATSTRQFGIFAGALVSLHWAHRLRVRATFPALVYWLTAGIVMYATWPFLWKDPLGRLRYSVLLAADFPVHTTLFRGLDVGSNALPWDYFPTLAGLQLTVPAVLLILLGLAVLIWKLLRASRRSSLIGLLALWIAVPTTALVLRILPAYGIRHLIFLFPPLFVLAGLGIEVAMLRLRPTWAQALAFGAVILPGILGIVRLHPYESIYFNELAGGVSAADGKYELDRWCLSYREATEAVNRLAGPRAIVGVPTQTNQIEPFLRADLSLVTEMAQVEAADVVISCTWRSEGDWHTRDFERVYEVRRGSAVLTGVWQRRTPLDE